MYNLMDSYGWDDFTLMRQALQPYTGGKEKEVLLSAYDTLVANRRDEDGKPRNLTINDTPEIIEEVKGEVGKLQKVLIDEEKEKEKIKKLWEKRILQRVKDRGEDIETLVKKFAKTNKIFIELRVKS